MGTGLLNDDRFTIYTMSDSTGQTAETLSKAAIRQFKGTSDIKHTALPRITRPEQIDKIIEVLSQSGPCMVAYTLSVPSLKELLQERAAEAGITVVDLLNPLIHTISSALNIAPPHREGGILRELDEEYYRRIESVEFAIRFDDGKDPKGLELADIILVGVSRTSKTPTCMFLAQNYAKKVCNNPLLFGHTPPKELFENKHKAIGLKVRPEVLLDIRKARVQSLGLPNNAIYAQEAQIEKELAFARDVMEQLGCPVVDVSHKAIEETASEIIHLRYPKPITRKIKSV